MNINTSTLRLFNAIQVNTTEKTDNILLHKTLKYGFVLSPEVANVADDNLITEISDVIGITQQKANSSFHKSWKKIVTASLEQLIVEQILHYITTYGFESVGIYDKDSVYIPAEQLDIPEITDDIKLTVIKGLTADEILNKIIELGSSGIALKTETLDDIINIVEYNKYSSEFSFDIKNNELKTRLFDLYDVVPERPIDFLRYVVTKITGESLLIKSSDFLAKIESSKSILVTRTLDKLLEKAPQNLAEIFFRYKPIFLALKKISKNKTFFNQLRKKANKMHKPMSEDMLNAITAKIKKHEDINEDDLISELNSVNIFRKIRLANALLYRISNPESIVYRIRNGKGYVADFKSDNMSRTLDILAKVKTSIYENLDVKDKIIYIPEYIEYAVPATEKMFTGNFPTGTYIKSSNDLVFGIHWFNTQHRVDLDLSMVSVSGKIGWDRNYYNSDKSVVFSGDVTSAPKPNGASELFYVKDRMKESSIVMVNHFNKYEFGDDVEAKIVVSSVQPDSFGKNYMIDVNNLLVSTNINITTKENLLGMVSVVDNENRFYFANMVTGQGATARKNEKSKKVRKYLEHYLFSELKLSELLESAGARVVREKPEDEEYVDLSPENIDKTTIINLLTSK